ncbi:AAA family ATPase [Anabaena cylindrica FACHB-243]|uniref:SMC domain protein n=1 Tax=Anabaena cylindrica (strain ATCC 27899 / PCC 7122) TaxID=272123 RepID=K9ZL00_ANACC|nr:MULTISPECIES: AAA family ATPase [Anabaena]AFZ59202.1 SMC domain protein [Anabaena cylindrica PCC 7122]MBD2416552.1 AAA family ATPase [Anabaena cylindrica FACHB-243]MBY5280949.1 AAA family ATPase [Anabaena sp. CCAP 1446/1C]MBY5311622.1 AAA family ATPase [Anabaena sp. CCAP 1446/1C]MCM2407492.1 AAA family ATPase [Anabaena sp. CCAP 1446/1C]
MLQRLIINGFKSIKTMDIELRPLNILIGANGAGKSNLISFFKMLNEMMAGRLQQYIGISGYAQSLLHFGPKITPQIEAQLEFEFLDGNYTYNLRLFHAAGDTLIFAEETLTLEDIISWKNEALFPTEDSLGAGHQETKINEASERGMQTSQVIKFLLNRCRVYHFHDTSSTAAVRQSCYVGDNHSLMPDAGNLAALLLRFRADHNIAYQRIVKTIRLIAPFFDDFDLEPRANNVILNWREKGSDQVFGSHQFSDGTLRAICLATLLLQPDKELPKLIIVDEPELGLHPYALNIVAAMFGKASYHTQILISTQSTSFLDNFNPEDVIVVDRVGKESQFKRLNPEELETWLEEYSLGEIWEKNIISGGPH